MLDPIKTANLLEMKSRTMDREAELIKIEREAIADFEGTLDDLESALGVLRMGDYWGWRVLILLHNKRTIRKYEDILNIKIKEFFPAETSQSERSVAYKIAKKLNKFWKAVSGDFKIDNRRTILQNSDKNSLGLE